MMTPIDALSGLGDPTSTTRLQAAMTIAQEEIEALAAEDPRRLGFDPARLPEFTARVRALQDAGDEQRAARVTAAALALLLREHAREMLHTASATAAHRTAVERIGVALQGLEDLYGERVLNPRGDKAELACLHPARSRRRLGGRRRALPAPPGGRVRRLRR